MAGSTTYKYILDLQARTGKFANDVRSSTAQAKTNIEKVNTSAKKTVGVFKNIAVAAGLAFGAREIVSFTKELVKLSGEAEGVRAAFNRVAKADTMRQLEKATAGTVSKIELMKRTVTASNLGLPVENLANLFEFATKRAQDTGESVDYLVNSIVTGIGRKSPLILDNLGISAIQLREKLKGVGMESASVADVAAAVGEIAADSMRKSGDIIDTNATKVANLGKQWEDFKLAVAENEGFKNAVGETLTEWQQFMNVMFSDLATSGEKWRMAFAGDEAASKIYEKVKARQEQQEEIRRVNAQYEEMYKKARQGADATNENTDAAAKQVTTYGDLLQQISDYRELLKKADITNTGYVKTLYAEIEALQKKKQAFEDLAKTPHGTTVAPEAMQSLGFNTASLGGVTPDASELGNMESWMRGQQEYLAELTKSWWEYAENINAVTDSLQYGFEQIGYSVVESLGLADSGFEGFAKSLAGTVTQLVSMALAQSIATSVANASQSAAATGPAAIITQPAFIATLIGGVLGAFAKIPKFADGGLAYGPTMGLVGEYPGAKNDPEVIAPLSKLQGMLNKGSVQVKLAPAIEVDNRRLKVGLKEVDYIESRVR